MGERSAGTILVVEDGDELRFVLTTQLRASGYRTLEASDGRNALQIARDHLPDVIIMDIGLPIMNGIDTTRALKSDPRTAPIPVIMLTAHSGPADVVRGLDAGAQEYLPKPFDVAELLARVRSVHRLAVSHRALDQMNSQLEAEVDRKTDRLRLLYEYMRDLNQVNTRDRVLDLLVRCVEQTTGAKRVSLFLLETGGDKLICERSIGLDSSAVQPITLDTKEGITGQVFRSGKTLSAKTFGRATDGGSEYKRDAFLSTPLISTSLRTPEGVIGVLNVTEKGDDVPFEEDEVDCIQSIADAATIALENIDRRKQLEQSVRVLLRTVGHLAEYRDDETTMHLERVSVLARILATELQRDGAYASVVTDDFIDSLVQAAPMHDIGKVGISDDILTKPGKLTDEEYQIMKTHTDIGRRVLSQALDPAHPVPLLQVCVDIAYCHHERWDGKGYPRRISERDIPLSARIITLVDAYDAMTSRRRYKEASSHHDAVAEIKSESGGHFDPVLVEAFLRCQEQFERVSGLHETTPEPIPAASL